MMADNIQNVRSYFLGVSLPCRFLGVSLIIHTFITFYALEDTSENLHKFSWN